MILLYYEGNKNAIYNKTTVDIHSLVNYPLNMHLSDSHPALLVVVPKIHEKAIIHLEPDEIAILLDNIESYGDTLSGHKKAYYEKQKHGILPLLLYMIQSIMLRLILMY